MGLRPAPECSVGEHADTAPRHPSWSRSRASEYAQVGAAGGGRRQPERRVDAHHGERAAEWEVRGMAKPSVRRSFEVDAPLEEAWHRLAEVERWPEWAPHIVSVEVSPPGELGPTSSGAFRIKGAGAQHVPHVGVGAAQQVGVGRGRARGADLVRPPVRGVRSQGDPARVVSRASRAIGVPRSADLRQGLRTERRPRDPAVAGLVRSLCADRGRSRGRLTSAT